MSQTCLHTAFSRMKFGRQTVSYRRAIRWKGPRPTANGFRQGRRHDMERSPDGESEASSTGNDVVRNIRLGAAMKALEHPSDDVEVYPLANGRARPA